MKRIIFILFGAVALFFAGVFLFYQPPADKFPASTTINGIDVSGLTIQGAENKLSEDRKSKNFTFVYKGQSYSVPMKALTFDLAAESVMSSMTHLEKFRYFLRMGNEYEMQTPPNESEEFLSEIAALPICDNSEKVKTTDAYVDLSDFEFRTVREKIGTEVDPANIRDIAFKSITAGELSAELTDAAIVRQPDLKADSAEFGKRLQYCKTNLSYQLEYDILGETEVVTPEQLDEMITYSKDDKKYHKKKIISYVDSIAARVNEYNQTYSFTTHYGQKINVRGVTFGRVLDKETMVKDLQKALAAQKSQKMELKWAQVKYSGGEGIGNSYIEVSIANQHVWCYRNGKVVVDCDCVTGAPGHDTARGVFIVLYVTGPTTLKGDNGDGTRYESPVNCFIPFYGGQGFHGSNGWRSQWGGNIYQTAGSHGCVNCPDAAAKKMADTVGYGYPVVIY